MKQRLAVVEYVRQYGIKPASRQFGLASPPSANGGATGSAQGSRGWCVSTLRGGGGESVTTLWRSSRRLDSSTNLARAARGRTWLERMHPVRVATETIQRVFRDIGVPYLMKTRRAPTEAAEAL